MERFQKLMTAVSVAMVATALLLGTILVIHNLFQLANG